MRILKFAQSSISFIACVNLELSFLCKTQFRGLTLWAPNLHQLIKLDMAISAAPLSPIHDNWLYLFTKGDWRDLDMIHACATACIGALPIVSRIRIGLDKWASISIGPQKWASIRICLSTYGTFWYLPVTWLQSIRICPWHDCKYPYLQARQCKYQYFPMSQIRWGGPHSTTVWSLRYY